MDQELTTDKSGNPFVALVPLGIALNLSLGVLVHSLRLPLYLDAVGTIAITIVAGLRAGITVGVLSFVIGSLLVNPVLVWFSGTQAVIALFTHYCATRGWFRATPRVIACGIGLGVIAGIVSSPIIVYLFGGISGSGRSLITAVMLQSGHQLLESVFYSGLASEPLDKTIQCLLAVWLLRGVPSSLLKPFNRELLVKNRFLVTDGEVNDDAKAIT